MSFLSFQYSFIDSAFHPTSQLPIFKVSIDLTSRFLVLSDINRNVKYKKTRQTMFLKNFFKNFSPYMY